MPDTLIKNAIVFVALFIFSIRICETDDTNIMKRITQKLLKACAESYGCKENKAC
jgi:hypothetical protein